MPYVLMAIGFPTSPVQSEYYIGTSNLFNFVTQIQHCIQPPPPSVAEVWFSNTCEEALKRLNLLN